MDDVIFEKCQDTRPDPLPKLSSKCMSRRLKEPANRKMANTSSDIPPNIRARVIIIYAVYLFMSHPLARGASLS
jgi:hypothetical protein